MERHPSSRQNLRFRSNLRANSLPRHRKAATRIPTPLHVTEPNSVNRTRMPSATFLRRFGNTFVVDICRTPRRPVSRQASIGGQKALEEESSTRSCQNSVVSTLDGHTALKETSLEVSGRVPATRWLTTHRLINTSAPFMEHSVAM